MRRAKERGIGGRGGAGRVREESPGRKERWGRLGPGVGAESEGWR